MPIVVIAETEQEAFTPGTLECVSEGRELADALKRSLHVVVVGGQAKGESVPELVEGLGRLAAYGASEVHVISHSGAQGFSADGWLALLEEPLRGLAPSVLLAPDSGRVRAWLPRLALRWRVPLISRCTLLRASGDGGLRLERLVYNGLQRESLRIEAEQPVFVTLKSDVRGTMPLAPAEDGTLTIHEILASADSSSWRDITTGRVPPDAATIDISEAERIVSGGLGIGSPDAVELLWQLARALNATVAGTRVISDRGWIPHERYIGSTGKIVKPNLYLALGISGASQHIVGMAESETIIAVNTDRTAPIFGLADLGVVGDLHDVVPALLKKLEEYAIAG